MTHHTVLGIGTSHNGGACVVRDGEILVAIGAERLTGRKREIGWNAWYESSVYCLESVGSRIADEIEIVAVTSDWLTSNDLKALGLRSGASVVQVGHHWAHATSALYTSGFTDASILVADGVGDPVADGHRETVTLYSARGAVIEPIHVMTGHCYGGPLPVRGLPSFRSLGGMYSAFSYLTFGSTMDAGKIMGLAPCGTPSIPIEQFFAWSESSPGNGSFEFVDTLVDRFADTRPYPADIELHEDAAASCQRALESGIAIILEQLHEKAPSQNLCFAGGLALNSVANSTVVSRSHWPNVWIPPFPDDSGLSIGAALAVSSESLRNQPPMSLYVDSFGRTYSGDEVARVVEAFGDCLQVQYDCPVSSVASLLSEGEVVGFFQGGSEVGPRALGHRSILADPRTKDMRRHLNTRVKRREPFRPFAPAVLAEHAAEWFDIAPDDSLAGFMLRVVAAKPIAIERAPAVVHVDGTARVQVVKQRTEPVLHSLVSAFHESTKVPLLLNTSFNTMGAPIVETPSDAIWMLLVAGLDACWLDGTLIRPAVEPTKILERLRAHKTEARKVADDAGPDDWLSVHLGETEPRVLWSIGQSNLRTRRVSRAVSELAQAADGSTCAELVASHSRDLDSRSALALIAEAQRAGLINVLP